MFDFLTNLNITRRRALVLVAVVAAITLAAIIFYIARLNRQIAEERERAAASVALEVKETRLRAPSTDGVTAYLDSSDVRAIATFGGVHYLATSGGLIALDSSGNVTRRYTTLDGLPENDLTALAVFRDRLYAGTGAAGLIAFDGNTFTGFTFTKPKATHVSALAASDSELLIGTLDGGLFEYDGERFTRRFNSATGADFSRVTALLPLDSRLYIGTQDLGLYVWREAQIQHIGTGEGLPSPHVTALSELPSSLKDAGVVAVATDFGVVALTDAGEVRPISSQPNVTSLVASGNRLWAGLFTGGMVDLSGGSGTRKGASGEINSPLAETSGLPRSEPVVVSSDDEALWALTSEGAYMRSETSAGPAFKTVASSVVSDRVLTGAHITSLTFDGAGRLWVGYFDRGIDIIAPESNERLSHVEDDRVREVNFITFDRGDDTVLAATSRGLVVFGAGLKQSVFTRDQNGLISDSIAHISLADGAALALGTGGTVPASAATGRALVLATAGGLTEIFNGRARSLTAFHGLASNHLYTSAVSGSRLFAGSLAGLVELEGLRVVRTYKTSNSPLSHDWVTALAEADGTLYIGTNGGGVDALLPTGEWVNFSDQIGRFDVNQNALVYDGERIYAGTGDRGLLVYNTKTRRWTQVSEGLASQNVTAITTDDQYIYLGTMNGLMRIEKRVLR